MLPSIPYRPGRMGQSPEPVDTTTVPTPSTPTVMLPPASNAAVATSPTQTTTQTQPAEPKPVKLDYLYVRVVVPVRAIRWNVALTQAVSDAIGVSDGNYNDGRPGEGEIKALLCSVGPEATSYTVPPEVAGSIGEPSVVGEWCVSASGVLVVGRVSLGSGATLLVYDNDTAAEWLVKWLLETASAHRAAHAAGGPVTFRSPLV